MRIAVVNWTRRAVGGAEATMAMPLHLMARAGHEMAFWHEVDLPANRPLLSLPDGPIWCAETLGLEQALADLRDWRPDVVYAHGLLDPTLERRVLRVAPAVFFPHSYHGTCISGDKTYRIPRVRPCSRRFGRQCLLLYYPRRTGGLSPVTMLKGFRRQSQRLANLHTCRFLVVESAHMRTEYLGQGFAAERVAQLPFPPLAQTPADSLESQPRDSGDPWRLLFVGRMDPLKGGAELLRAMPSVAAALQRPLEITMAGDGPSATQWRQFAARLAANCPRMAVQFPGWLGVDDLPRAYRAADLLVMPSLWPEPFGRVGLEAGAFGVPTVAFAVGGIPEWLTDGVNGHLAPGNPPTVGGLAHAVARALQDPSHHEALCRGALAAAKSVNPELHTRVLLDVLQRAAGVQV